MIWGKAEAGRPRLHSIDGNNISFLDDRKDALGFGSFGSVHRVDYQGFTKAAKVIGLLINVCRHVC